MTSGNELIRSFDSFFKVVLDQISEQKDVDEQIYWSFNRIKDIVNYNVPHGKRTRGLTLVSAFHAMKKGNVTETEANTALALGWAVEMQQAAFLVADDIMDQSETRRGKLCWYKQPNIGFQAINDSMILESCIFVILKKWCRNLECYADLFDLFHSVILNTEMGQSLDMATSEQPDVDFSRFTIEKYSSIIKYKTAYYSFYLPVAVAMYLAGVFDQEIHKKTCDLLTKIGNLFQIQDDFLDCFGDPVITGKIGTDIEDNKCTWIIIKAIEQASPSQLKSLEENYGKKDPSKVKIVKQVYNELELTNTFENYEKEQYELLCCEIDNFDEIDIPKSIFLNLLNKIYKRKK